MATAVLHRLASRAVRQTRRSLRRVSQRIIKLFVSPNILSVYSTCAPREVSLSLVRQGEEPASLTCPQVSEGRTRASSCLLNAHRKLRQPPWFWRLNHDLQTQGDYMRFLRLLYPFAVPTHTRELISWNHRLCATDTRTLRTVWERSTDATRRLLLHSPTGTKKEKEV